MWLGPGPALIRETFSFDQTSIVSKSFDCNALHVSYHVIIWTYTRACLGKVFTLKLIQGKDLITQHKVGIVLVCNWFCDIPLLVPLILMLHLKKKEADKSPKNCRVWWHTQVPSRVCRHLTVESWHTHVKFSLGFGTSYSSFKVY